MYGDISRPGGRWVIRKVGRCTWANFLGLQQLFVVKTLSKEVQKSSNRSKFVFFYDYRTNRRPYWILTHKRAEYVSVFIGWLLLALCFLRLTSFIYGHILCHPNIICDSISSQKTTRGVKNIINIFSYSENISLKNQYDMTFEVIWVFFTWFILFSNCKSRGQAYKNP